MNQIRTFLIFGWLAVAFLLYREWSAEHAPPPPTTTAASAAIPDLTPGKQVAAIPGAGAPPPAAAATTTATPATPAAPGVQAASARITVSTDVLRLVLDGTTFYDAELLRYPQAKTAGSPPVKLFETDPARYYGAQSGWVGQNGAAAPGTTGGFVPEGGASDRALADGQQTLEVPFTWQADGVRIRRVYVLQRGSYVVRVRDEVANDGTRPWQGYVYRQLARVPPELKSGMTNPESYSFTGATWFSAEHGYDRRKFKSFVDDGPLGITVQGGWIALLQHHFFTAWIPQHDQQARFDLLQTGNVDGIRAMGPAFDLAPGARAGTEARLWVGPKLVAQIKAQAVPGLDRAVDYSRFDVFATLAEGLFWVLSKLHALLGNWGWSIVAMVLLLKLALFPLSAAQYKSAAKMRRFQPRIAQLKERYGDDKQKFQLALMELYKKEKINPVGGCLPILPQMIIFMALYWMLAESVELRQAPWTLWVQDLTARDPYFILPIVNMAIMWTTQRLTPAVGMDPMQQKMMQAMPLAFGVILAFLPAGLVLYQVANGGLGLLQQWYMLRKYGDPPPKQGVVDKP